jgi:hypothetical protein
MAKKLKLDHLMDKINQLFTDEEKGLFESVILKGEGPHFCWSIVDKTMMKVSSASELYILPNKQAKDGNLYIFSPWIGGQGIIFLVPEEKLTKIGLN